MAEPSRSSSSLKSMPELAGRVADAFEGPDVLGLSPQSKHCFGLLEHGIDAAQPVRLRAWHLVEAMERVIEIGQCVAVGPTALRFFCGQYRVINSLFDLIASTKMDGQEFRDFFCAAAIQLFERASDCAMTMVETYLRPTPSAPWQDIRHNRSSTRVW